MKYTFVTPVTYVTCDIKSEMCLTHPALLCCMISCGLCYCGHAAGLVYTRLCVQYCCCIAASCEIIYYWVLILVFLTKFCNRS